MPVWPREQRRRCACTHRGRRPSACPRFVDDPRADRTPHTYPRHTRSQPPPPLPISFHPLHHFLANLRSISGGGCITFGRAFLEAASLFGKLDISFWRGCIEASSHFESPPPRVHTSTHSSTNACGSINIWVRSKCDPGGLRSTEPHQPHMSCACGTAFDKRKKTSPRR